MCAGGNAAANAIAATISDEAIGRRIWDAITRGILSGEVACRWDAHAA
jgi:hypothetical protein